MSSEHQSVAPFFTMTRQARIARTTLIAEGSSTDVERWKDPRNLESGWRVRASCAARLIPSGSHVLDLGAGSQELRRLLPPGCRYTPADVVARTADTIVADMNHGEFPQGRYDIAVALGLLEYIHQIDQLLRHMKASAPAAVVSYSARTGGTQADRLQLGWVNNLSLVELISSLLGAGWTIAVVELLDRSALFDQWLLKLQAS